MTKGSQGLKPVFFLGEMVPYYHFSVGNEKPVHRDEKPTHCNEEWPPLATTRESPRTSSEDPTQPKQINK